jgi:hypothetical protein
MSKVRGQRSEVRCHGVTRDQKAKFREIEDFRGEISASSPTKVADGREIDTDHREMTAASRATDNDGEEPGSYAAEMKAAGGEIAAQCPTATAHGDEPGLTGNATAGEIREIDAAGRAEDSKRLESAKEFIQKFPPCEP